MVMKKVIYSFIVIFFAIACGKEKSPDEEDNNIVPSDTYNWLQEVGQVKGFLNSKADGRAIRYDDENIYDSQITQIQNYIFTLNSFGNIWTVNASLPVQVSGSYYNYELAGLKTGTDAYLQSTLECISFKGNYALDVNFWLDCDAVDGTCTLQFQGGSFSGCVVSVWDIQNGEWQLGPNDPAGDFDAWGSKVKKIRLPGDKEVVSVESGSKMAKLMGVDKLPLGGYSTDPGVNLTWELNFYAK